MVKLDGQAIRLMRRSLSFVVVGITLASQMFLASPLVFWCCRQSSANVQRLLVSVTFVAMAALGAFAGGLASERDDRWFAFVQSTASVGFGLLGIAFSAVESGNVAVVENLVIALGGVVGTWGGYFAALPFHKRGSASKGTVLS